MGLPEAPALGASALPAGTFDGQAVIVTGGGTGLGKAIAVEFGRLGAAVAILSRSEEHRPKGVAAVVLYPGAVSTEFIVDSAKQTGMDLSKAQTPLFVGRAAAALLGADDLMKRSGSIQWVEDLAEEFDLYDENGTRPPPYPLRQKA